MQLFCVEHHIMTVQYFLDECQEYEIAALVDMLPYDNRDLWEMTRNIVYTEVQIHSKKKIKPKDILKFIWDYKNGNSKADHSISNEDIDRLRKLAKNFEK